MKDVWTITRQDLEESPYLRKVDIVDGLEDVWDHFARTTADLIKRNNGAGKPTLVILPVGPFDYRRLAELCNREGIQLDGLFTINMDEYCNETGDDWIPISHPLSFRGHMEKNFFSLLDGRLGFGKDNALFPHPGCPESVQNRIKKLGGVDVCFAGFGINGHVAFNEPPEPHDEYSADQFAALPTRVVDLTRETITQNAILSAGGDLGLVPRKAITIGMAEIMESKVFHGYVMRDWHRMVIRRCLFGPKTPGCPGSIVLQTHPHCRLTMPSFVADLPSAGLL